jgi:hypothetical protein
MSIKEKLSLKALGYLNLLHGWLNVYLYLQGYYLRKNIEYANTFIEKFRSRKKDPNNFSAQKRSKPNVNCTHLKGGRPYIRKYVSSRDYNILVHNFSDGTTKAWCGYGCGFVSHPGDPNWDEAKRMMEESSNTQSGSERVFWAIDRPGKDTVYVTKDPTIVTVQDKWGNNDRT